MTIRATVDTSGGTKVLINSAQNQTIRNSTPKATVNINTLSGNRVAMNNQQRKTVRTVISGSTTSIATLEGVDVSGAVQNDTLVYDDESGLFLAKELPVINGGTF